MTDAPVNAKQKATTPITVHLPNGQKVTSSHTCELNLPNVPLDARLGHILPGLAGHSLVSVVRLCNAGCKVNFKDIGVEVIYNGNVVLEGHKDPHTGLWMVPLNGTAQRDTTAPATQLQQTASSVFDTATRSELVQYHHQSLFAPPASTIEKAIANGQLRSFPGLTPGCTKILPPSTATYKGHMKRARQGLRSTRRPVQEIRDARKELQDMNPQDHIARVTEGDIDFFCHAALADSVKGTVYTDITGRFPARSYKGNQYIMLAYVYQTNSILVRAMKSREATEQVEAMQDIYEYLTKRGYKPRLNVMDNECSKTLRDYIEGEKVKIQLVEPDNHRVNAAERAIQTFKNHFIAGLSCVDQHFPLQLWDEILKQAEITLNLLRTSRQDPSKSAYEELEGPFDYNRTPLAPPGTKALVYNDPTNRRSWEQHAKDGWYVGPAMAHYRCKRFWIPETRNFRTAATYKLFPKHCKLPVIDEVDEKIIAADELAQELKRTIPKT
ncbi:hypothetical protein ACHAWF_008701, partial [Thalassiosira exigua]